MNRNPSLAWPRPRSATLAFVSMVVVPAGLLAGVAIDPGWDLFTTIQPTTFGGVQFNGVPLGTFDFGGTIGVQPVGNTDTIVQRLAQANAPSQAIPIELVSLSLVSVAPVDFGLGLDFYYITLQSARGGPLSPGQMTVSFGPEGDPHGTVDSSFFDIFFDVRKGALSGPIALSDNLPFNGGSTTWSHLPNPGSIEIPGANTLLNGTDRTADFFLDPPYTITAPAGAMHTLGDALVPEPSTWAAGGVIAALTIWTWRRRHEPASR